MTVKRYHRVEARIDLDAIVNNVKNAKKLLKEGTKFLAVVKADAYGHGAIPIAHAIDDMTDMYGVAILEEGIALRQSGIKKPILILGYTQPDLYEAMIRFEVTTAVFTLEMGKRLSQTAQKMGKTAHIHIKLDTGMSRIGFLPNEKSLREIQELVSLPGLSIDGCFTHFAQMDEKDKTSAKRQFESYQDFVWQIEDTCGITIPIHHVSNSAGIMEMPEVHLDMVRDGISLYGMYPSEEVQKNKLPLQPAMELKSYVSYVKELPAGVKIGYGGTFTTTRPSQIATIPVGYADGYPRSLSNQGEVLIQGQRFPIVGRICMDQFMVDVTEADNVIRQDDEVTLAGRDGEEFLSIEEVANLAGSFNYEFVCDIGWRVPRVYFQKNQAVLSIDHYAKY